MTKGNVYVDRLPGRFEGKQWPSVEGAMRFNVCSSSNQKINGHSLKQLSPFFVGPIEIELPVCDMGGNQNVVVTNIENFWQASKVWRGETRRDIPQPVIDLIPEHGNPDYSTKMYDETGFAIHDFIPNQAWFDRRAKYWSDPVPHRRIKRGDKKNNDDPMFCWWRGDALPYVEARCRMYIPMYADLASKTPAFKELKALVGAGHDVLLIGYDGYKIERRPIELLADPTVRFGHELVLACMLHDAKPWETLYLNIERCWKIPQELIPDVKRKREEKKTVVKKQRKITDFMKE